MAHLAEVGVIGALRKGRDGSCYCPLNNVFYWEPQKMYRELIARAVEGTGAPWSEEERLIGNKPARHQGGGFYDFDYLEIR